MDTLSKPNFMIFGVTVYEKNAMITYKIKSCTIVLINNFEILKVIIAFLSDTLRPTKLKFFFILTDMDTLCKPNLMLLGRTVFEKNAMIT